MTWFNYNYPCCSGGKESTCNAGELCLSPRSGKSPGGGIGYPLQYFWASLRAQLIKTLPAMRETWIWSLGWEDPLVKKKATHFSILKNSMNCIVHVVSKSWTWLSDFHFTPLLETLSPNIVILRVRIQDMNWAGGSGGDTVQSIPVYVCIANIFSLSSCIFILLTMHFQE